MSHFGRRITMPQTGQHKMALSWMSYEGVEGIKPAAVDITTPVRPLANLS
jgi:hypothetical protein